MKNDYSASELFTLLNEQDECDWVEAKGGKSSSRSVMESVCAYSNEPDLVPPTFESSRQDNQFVSRLLLHHFLNEEDLKWLSKFEDFSLLDYQKQALVFVREVGAIDNSTYRQMANVDVVKASTELRDLKVKNFLEARGSGKATYYIPGTLLRAPASDLSTPASGLSTPASGLSTSVRDRLAPEVLTKIDQLGKRINDKTILEAIIKEICTDGYFKSTEIAEILGRREDYVKRKFLNPMIKDKQLVYRYSEMINHPNQAYRTKNRNQRK